MNNNRVRLKAYSSGSTEVRNADLNLAQNIQFTKGYPGGQSLSLTFFVPRKVTSTWTLAGHQRITAWNGLNMVWEGEIVSITPTLQAGTQGMTVTCAGYWSTLLMARKTHKPWADTRTDESIWKAPTAAYNANDISLLETCSIDRANGIKFVPKSTRDAAGAENGWSNNAYVRLIYTAPVGQTIKRVTCNVTLAEAGQQWRIGMFNHDLTVAHWDLTASGGPTAKDVTLATPDQTAMILFQSQAGQNPPTDGTVYGLVTDIVVYTETGTIDAQAITTDIAGYFSELSTDVSRIGAENTILVPFINDPPQTYADALINAMSYGDTSYNRWGVYVDTSDKFTDGKPGLVLQTTPILTDFDYSIRMEENTVKDSLAFTQEFDGIRNWIVIIYTDASGRTIYLTPDDDSTLKDTTSIANYGQREEWISLPTTLIAAAQNYGRRFLAQHKDPQWKANGQLVITGTIRAKNGNPVPTSQVVPGLRIKIENWLNDLSGNGLTFLISGTSYNDNDESCSLDIGQPNTLEFTILQMKRIQDNMRKL